MMKKNAYVLGFISLLFTTMPCWSENPGNKGRSSPAQSQVNTPVRKILPEGFSVAGKNARLVRLPRDTRWFLIFDAPAAPNTSALASNQPALKTGTETEFAYDPNNPDPLAPPIEVLPGRWLATMINIVGDKNDLSVKFRIWGEVTAYQGRNYILPTMINMVSLFGQPPEKTDKKTPSALTSQDSASGLETTAPPISSTPREEGSLPSQLREALMAIPRAQPLNLAQDLQANTTDKLVPDAGSASDNNGKDISSGGPQAKEGQMVVDRVGWLAYAPEQQRWLFIFEADGPNRSEPPVIIHPCRLLELMEEIVLRATRQPRFRISGQYTNSQGKGFLLIRKTMVVYDLGNIHK